VVFVLLPFSKISLAYIDPAGFTYLFAAFLCLTFYCRKRNLLRLAPALEAVSLGLLMTIPILVSTYLAASIDLPLADDALKRADAALGFKWMPFIEFIDDHPSIAHTLARAYSSFGVQLLALPLILGVTGRCERAYLMIMTYGVICYAASIVSIWFPALGTYTVYGLGQDQLQNINAYYGFASLPDFVAVREQPAFVLSIANASGIVTFPSVHAAGAALCAWAAWDLRPIRYPLAGWNLLMAVSAVTHANHYVVDVIAGITISAASIFLVTKTLRHAAHVSWRFSLPAAIWARNVRRQRDESESPTVS
jgi:membrane-associated phospholipid phosphatase